MTVSWGATRGTPTREQAVVAKCAVPGGTSAAIVPEAQAREAHDIISPGAQKTMSPGGWTKRNGEKSDDHCARNGGVRFDDLVGYVFTALYLE